VALLHHALGVRQVVAVVTTIGGLLIHSAIRYVRIAVLLSLLVRL